MLVPRLRNTQTIIFFKVHTWIETSLVAQLVSNPPAMLGTWIWALGWENPLEKGTATYSKILAWIIPWTVVHEVTKSWTGLNDFYFHMEISNSNMILSKKIFIECLLSARHGVNLSDNTGWWDGVSLWTGL